MLYGFFRSGLIASAIIFYATSFGSAAQAEMIAEPFVYQFTTQPITDDKGYKVHTEITVFEIDLTAPDAANQITATSALIQEKLEQDQNVPKAFISIPLSEKTKQTLGLEPIITRKQEEELDAIILGDQFSKSEKFNFDLDPEHLGINTEKFLARNSGKANRSLASEGTPDLESEAWKQVDRLYKEQHATFRYRLIYIRGFGNGKFTVASVIRGGVGLPQAIVLGTLAGTMSAMAQKYSKFLGDYVMTKEYTSKFKNVLRSWVSLQKQAINKAESKTAAALIKWGTVEVAFAGIFTIAADLMGTLPSPEIFGHSLVGYGGRFAEVLLTSGLVMFGQGRFETMRTKVVKSKAVAFLQEGKLQAAVLLRKHLDKVYTMGSYIAVSGMAMKMIGVETGSYIALGVLLADSGITYTRYKIPAFDRAMAKVDAKLKPITNAVEKKISGALDLLENAFHKFKCKLGVKKKPRDFQKSDFDGA